MAAIGRRDLDLDRRVHHREHRSGDLAPEHHDRLAGIHLGHQPRPAAAIAAIAEHRERRRVAAPEVLVERALDQPANGGYPCQPPQDRCGHAARSIHNQHPESSTTVLRERRRAPCETLPGRRVMTMVWRWRLLKTLRLRGRRASWSGPTAQPERLE